MEIEGRTFLVAGGGSGLGAATTEMLTNEGANAVVADLEARPRTATSALSRRTSPTRRA